MAIQNYYNKKGNFDKFWWVSPEIVPKESGMINLSVANRYKDYGKLKGSVWKWFRSQVNQKDLSPRNKIILWSLAERFRGQSFSVWDSYTYLSKMVGLSGRLFLKKWESYLNKASFGLQLKAMNVWHLKNYHSKSESKNIFY